MIRSFDETLHRLTVPLPRNPLRETNAYLLRDGGEGRHLLIDNGFNTGEGRASLLQDLSALGIERDRLDVFITHMHADHNGLTSACIGEGSAIYMGEREGRQTNASLKPKYWEEAAAFMERHGFPAAELAMVRLNHPAVKYASPVPLAFTAVQEGEELRYAGYRLRVLCVPGHTAQHMALYEPDRKLLFSGDHILGNITPNIQHLPDLPDALGVFLESLDKVAALDVALTLPGHREPVKDTRRRAAELKEHHAARLREVVRVLGARSGPMQAYDVAVNLRWSVKSGGWNDFPPQQKWFAAGEALAHLERLETLGRVARVMRDGAVFFTLA